MFFRYQHKSLQELVEIGEEEETDWGVIVLGTILLISILIYTSYMSYHNQELLQAIKNQFLIQLGYPIGSAVNDSTQDQSVPLKCSIPDPPPPWVNFPTFYRDEVGILPDPPPSPVG